MGYDGSLKFDTRLDESGFNSGIQKLGSIAKGGIAILGSVVAGGIASFAALTKASLDSVASLEQNVGGIETLFGAGGKSLEEYAKSVGKSTEDAKESYEQLINAQNLALDNANDAYKTAGLSANEYMSTVTSFAASLKQSVANETEAAEAANQAVIDMSDNANKMGTNMELIQNAYQGFAKQNYTMLDNLKLGYGGTKTEMERLLKDAQALTGVKYDINNLADVYQAIHIIQTELGITGTTAEEASSTIEGSMKSAQAAWDNFLAGTGTAEEFADTVGVAAENIIKNVAVIVPRLAAAIPKAVSEVGKEIIGSLKEYNLAEVGQKLISDVVTGVSEKAPEMASIGLNLLNSAVQGLTSNASLITEKAGEIVSKLISGIQENAPSMLTAAVDLLASFVSGVGAQLPELIPQALQMVVVLADAIISNIPTIVQAGISLLVGLVQGIIQSLPTLISEGPRIINEFANAIYTGIGDLLRTGWEMLKSLATGIWENRGLILENAGAILEAVINVFSLSKLFSLGKSLITNLGNGIKSMFTAIKTSGGDIIKNLITGIKNLATHPITTMKGIITNVINAFKGINWAEVGKNIISGIANGLKASAGAIVTAAKDAAKSALDSAKKFLGIKSPSRRFRDEVGKMMAEGMGIGFEKNIPVKNIEKGVDGIINKATRRLSIVNGRVPDSTSSIVNRVTNNYTGNSVDYRKLKEVQRQAMNEANQKPIVLNGRVLNRELRTGGPVTV